MMTIPLSKAVVFADSMKILSALKEAPEEGVSFDALCDDETLTANLFDAIGVSENAISLAFQSDDIGSSEQVAVIGDIVKELTYDEMIRMASGFAMEYDCSCENDEDEDKNEDDEDDEEQLEADAAMPPRKIGYKRVKAVRGGKKVWINKRNPNKRIILSPKQKAGLRKARRKTQTALAKYNRAKSMKVRKRTGMQ